MWKIDGNTIVSKCNLTLGFHPTDGVVASVPNNPMIEPLYVEKIEPTSNYQPLPGLYSTKSVLIIIFSYWRKLLKFFISECAVEELEPSPSGKYF